MSAPKDPQKREEWKQNISAGKAGKKIKSGPCPKRSEAKKGIPRKPETIAKMSSANTGVKWSEEHKKAHLEAIRRRVITPELSEKYSAAARGRKHTLEEIKKISDAHKGLPMHENARKNLHSPAARAKVSEKLKANFAAMSPEEQAAYVAVRVKARTGINRDTSLEIFVAHQLELCGVVYEQQKHIGRYVIDFLLSEQNLIIEVNGCYWHGCEQCGFNDSAAIERRKRDERRTAFLESKGYVVAILWQHDLLPFMKTQGD